MLTATRLRLLLPAALLASAVVLGGLAAVLATFAAVLLVIDQALDRVGQGAGAAAARERFRRARGRARLRRGASPLAYLPTDVGWAATAARRRLGVQPIALESVVGTVDEHKAAAFEAGFRPPAFTRGRWIALCTAAQRGAQLPPISVYRVGAHHYVRDGHHRVSVARALGAVEIDADVVELLSRSAAPAA